MQINTRRFSIFALTLALLCGLVAAPVHAAGAGSRAAVEASPSGAWAVGLWGQLTSWLDGLWPTASLHSGHAAAAAVKAGPGMDPNGSAGSSDTGDAGPGMDPNGTPTSSADSGDAGPGMDPNGTP